jgi:hypothetical protein
MHWLPFPSLFKNPIINQAEQIFTKHRNSQSFFRRLGRSGLLFLITGFLPLSSAHANDDLLSQLTQAFVAFSGGESVIADFALNQYNRDLSLPVANANSFLSPPPMLDVELTQRLKSSPVLRGATSRYYFKWILNSSERLGPIEITISSPTAELITPLPTLLVLAGTEKSEETVQLVSNPGQRYIVGLRYPLPATAPSGDLEVSKIEDFIDGLQNIPGHIAIALANLRRQIWVEDGSVSILGVSFGSIVLPFSVRLADLVAPSPDGTPLPSYIFAYGGANAKDYVKTELERNQKRPLSEDLSRGLDLLLLPLDAVDPKSHIPAMNGRFLQVQETEFTVIPEDSAKALAASLTLKGAQFVSIPGPHISRERTDLIDQLNQSVSNWLP